MRKPIVFLAILSALSACNNGDRFSSDDLLGQWKMVEVSVYEDSDQVFSGLLNQGNYSIYNFEQPSSSLYLWWESIQNNQSVGSSNSFEVSLDNDSLFLMGISNSAPNWSSSYRIDQLSNKTMILSWYSELPQKHEKTVATFEKQ